MNYAPIARSILRYGAGYLLGRASGETLAADPDVVAMLALALGALVEAAYAFAKRKGWAT